MKFVKKSDTGRITEITESDFNAAQAEYEAKFTSYSVNMAAYEEQTADRSAVENELKARGIKGREFRQAMEKFLELPLSPRDTGNFKMYSVEDMFGILNIPSISLQTSGNWMVGEVNFNGVKYTVEIQDRNVEELSKYFDMFFKKTSMGSGFSETEQEAKRSENFSFYCHVERR
jgi:hypothetical protein